MFMTIDPGLGGTGICVSGDELFPVETVVISSVRPNGSWIVRASDITIQVANFVYKLGDDLDRAYIELPTFFTSAKGASCATGKNGDDSDLVKLSVLIGRFYEIFYTIGIPVDFIRVNEWKAQLPKTVVAQRVASRLGCRADAFPNHAMDAVGMSLYVKGVFKANSVSNFNEKFPETGFKK